MVRGANFAKAQKIREGSHRRAAVDILLKSKNTSVALREFGKYNRRHGQKERLHSGFARWAADTGITKLL